MKKRAMLYGSVLALALQPLAAMPLQAQEQAQVDPAQIRVIDGEFCCISEEGGYEEEATFDLRDAAQIEKDITPLLELIGEPESEEYFGQGCWFGETGEENGEDGTWYYDNFVVYVYQTDAKTYYMGAGERIAEEESLLDLCEAVVSEQTKENDSDEEKLEKLFRYVEETCSYARKEGFDDYEDWQADYAREMNASPEGSCYHFAAYYAFLAKAALDAEVRICVGTSNGFDASTWQPHAWAQVKLDDVWHTFDPNLDKYGADSSLEYFDVDNESDLYMDHYQTENTYEVYFEDDWSEDEEEETEEVLEEETETETETEPETEVIMTTELSIDLGEEEPYLLANLSEVSFTEASLQEETLTLVDTDGEEHIFLEVKKEDLKAPRMVMYGNFLAIKYTSKSSGKAGRLTEEGDEIVFDEPEAMTMLSAMNIRSEADLNAPTMGQANTGSTVKVIAETGKWFKILLEDGREGYVSKVGVIAESDTEASAISSGETADGEAETEAETEPVPEIVVVERYGKYFRYERFTPGKDSIVEVNGEPCYVNADGSVSEGWKELDGKLYYSEADGTLVRSKKVDGIKLGKDGTAKDNVTTRLKMKTSEIVRSITDDSMAKADKLKACWNYVTRGNIYYAGKYPDLNAEYWQRSLALDALTTGSGNCYGYACAFAALAKEVGYAPQVVAGRVSGSRDHAADGMTRHSWVIIDGGHYDPEAQYAGWAGGIYGYGSYPINHQIIKIVDF